MQNTYQYHDYQYVKHIYEYVYKHSTSEYPGILDT